MKFISPRLHGYLDYGVVLVFLIAPTLFGLSGVPAFISYTLAIVHLGVTLLTAFPLGVAQVLPFRLHGMIEFVVSLALIALPWVLGFSAIPAPRNFYVIMGALIFLVWLVTAYHLVKPKAAIRDKTTAGAR